MSIIDNFSEAYLERVFMYVDALVESSNTEVIFKVSPTAKEQFNRTLATRHLQPVYTYFINENIA
ncbi:MAG: hypothetical protein CMC08_07050 [Flavobacteriaceae bacterium]|nr:hypothetical protein [Flavobacteriaceae bacterium]